MELRQRTSNTSRFRQCLRERADDRERGGDMEIERQER